MKIKKSPDPAWGENCNKKLGINFKLYWCTVITVLNILPQPEYYHEV